jgi:hypothetical protein
VKPITDKLLDSVPELQKNLLALSVDFDKLAIQFAKQKNKVSEINSLRTNLETYLKSNINFIDHQH